MDQAERLRSIIKQQNKKKHLARVITVSSGKGGVGKSNVSVNLAIQLSRLGKRVVILDADFGLANIEVMLGMRPKYNLADMMFHGRPLKEIIAPGPENVGFISGGSGIREMTNLNKDQLQSLIASMYELDNYADVVIIDTGAGIADSVTDLVMCSSEVILVTTPEPTSITDAYALLKTIHRQPEYDPADINIKMIGNRVQSYEEGKELYYKLNTVTRKFLELDLEYLGAIPEDVKMQNAVRSQKPVSMDSPNAASARALKDIALILENEKHTQEEIKSYGISGLLARMFKKNKR